MLVKGILRLSSNINLCHHGFCFSKINFLKYSKKIFPQKMYVSANVLLESKNHANSVREFSLSHFKDYILENNNFKNPVSEIINLNFTLDDKPESLKLMGRLKENPENENLWEETFDCMNKELKEFNVKDFLIAIALASDLNKNTDKNKFIKKLIESLDSEIRLRKLILDDVLEILFVLRHSLCARMSLKNFHFYSKFSRTYLKLDRFQPLQVVHIFYYFEEFNQSTKRAYKYAILKYVKNNMAKFNLDEAGIILSALVRGKLFTYDVELIKQVVSKIINEIEAVNSLHLFYASKFLLCCSSIRYTQVIKNFQEDLIPHTSKFNASSLIASLFSGYPYCLNLSLWDNIIDKVKSDMKSLGIVNIERMTRITTMFKVKDEEFLKLAVQTVEEMENIDHCFPHFVFFCKHLILHRIYSKKLIDKIFSKNFVENMISRKFSKEIVEWSFINSSLQIEKPEYQCLCLDKISEKKIMNTLYNFLPLGKPVLSSFLTRKKLTSFMKELYGENEIYEACCLPHFEHGIIMTFDENLKALPVPEEYKIRTKKIFKKPLNENIWICMNACYISPEGLNPTQETYKRHLSAIGYVPVLVSFDDFYQRKFSETEMGKELFKSLIQTAVHENLKEKEKKMNSLV